MKLIATFLLILAMFSAYASKKAEITVKVSDCRGKGRAAFISELKVLKNGVEFKTYKQLISGFILKDIELGQYLLIYESIFGKKEKIIVEIVEYKKYYTNLCVNYIDYSKIFYRPIIDYLKENESYIINISSVGCYHSTEDSLVIKRDKYTFTLFWGDSTKELNETDIEAIRHFEIEMNCIYDNNSCTTIDLYTVKYNGAIKEIEDGGCKWSGRYYLKKRLFGDG